MYIYPPTSNEIYHYGIKRRSGRYPYGSGDRPYQDGSRQVTRKEMTQAEKGKDRSGFIEAHTVPKGTKMYRTSVDQKDPDGPIYVTYMPSDRDYYRSTYLETIHNRPGNSEKNIYENKYVLKEDLKIPSREKSMEVKTKILYDSENYYRIVDEAIRQIYEPLKDKKISEFSPQELQKYKDYAQSISWYMNNDVSGYREWMIDKITSSKTFQKKLAEELSKEGYNAIIDEKGVGHPNLEGGRREGVSPLIIFDNSVLEKLSDEKLWDSEKSSDRNMDKMLSSLARVRSYNVEQARNEYQRKGIGKWSESEDGIIITNTN